MISGSEKVVRASIWATWLGILALAGVCAQAQSNANERTFPQSKATLEKALKALQGTLSGRLPSLEGFAEPAEHPLDRYQRGYYQTTVQVSANPSGGSVVRVNTKVTAWYVDPAGAHSGYQLLTSNGRLEADVLEQLSDQLIAAPPPAEKVPTAASLPKPTGAPATDTKSAVPAPAPAFPQNPRTFSSSVPQELASQAAIPKDQGTSEKTDSALQAEAASLEEILKNQAHPKNLVAVKKSGTPVVATPSLTAKPEFLASMHDEFEMLNFNADWVHVRISGLSRGWIWRNSVEMPEGIPDTDAPAASTLTPAADLFHVVREETAPFPGDWEPLRRKNVKIISVQKTDDIAKDAGSKDRLEYAKFLLEKNYGELVQKSQELAGIVVIFDSADGGMIAVTMPALQQWKAGTLSDAALWHQSFFDPPETLGSSSSAADH